MATNHNDDDDDDNHDDDGDDHDDDDDDDDDHDDDDVDNASHIILANPAVQTFWAQVRSSSALARSSWPLRSRLPRRKTETTIP